MVLVTGKPFIIKWYCFVWIGLAAVFDMKSSGYWDVCHVVSKTQLTFKALFAACFLLVSCLAYSFTLKTEAICPFRTSHGITSQKMES
jgi:hypothetical protein